VNPLDWHSFQPKEKPWYRIKTGLLEARTHLSSTLN